MDSGRNRLLIVVPVTFLLIFILLFAWFHSARLAALVFTGVPFAVTGGILALLVRGMPFSMSAGVGFSAVSPVAVLNGLLLVAFIGQFQKRGEPLETAVYQGTLLRLRPVLITAEVASLGFLPMVLSKSQGGGATPACEGRGRPRERLCSEFPRTEVWVFPNGSKREEEGPEYTQRATCADVISSCGSSLRFLLDLVWTLCARPRGAAWEQSLTENQCVTWSRTAPEHPKSA